MSRANAVRTSTGIEIGCAYLPPPPPPSADAEVIQAALLRKSEQRQLGTALGRAVLILLCVLGVAHLIARLS